jgi:hypothetical protein
MALSQKVKDSLDEAQSHIRTALSYASRNEKPIVNKQISEIMYQIESIIKYEQMTDKLEEMVEKFKNDGKGGFFGF